jgi:mono/diheme cytochrome c family protein
MKALLYIVPAVLAGAFLSVSASKAAPDELAIQMGHGLAERLCTNCHAIEPGKFNKPGHVGGPSFQSVANRPDINADSLREHLRMTHSNAMIPLAMPNPGLSEDELMKIVSYILSLRAGR